MDNDLISRSELKKALCEFMKNNIGIYSNEMFHIVDSMPTVNLEKQSFIEGFKGGCEHGKKCYERPQGEWIHYLGCGVGKAVCSECGQLGETKKYCGNCGADMRGKEE